MRRLLGRLLLASLRRYETSWNKRVRNNEGLRASLRFKIGETLYLYARDWALVDRQKAMSEQDLVRLELDHAELHAVTGPLYKQECRKPFGWTTGSLFGANTTSEMLHDTARLLSLLSQFPETHRILEAGGGSGWLSYFLALHGYEMTCTTLSPHEVAIANRRWECWGKDGIGLGSLTARVGDMMNLESEPTSSYDAVLVYAALHHVPDPFKAIREFARVLRPGGLLILLNEPNIAHTIRAKRGREYERTHEWGFRRRRLLGMLRQSGFYRVRRIGTIFRCGLLPLRFVAIRQFDVDRPVV